MRTTLRRGCLAAVAVAAVAALTLPAAAAAKPSTVKVMTRNLYLGADLTPALAAPNAPAAYQAGGDIYEAMLDTNFIARSRVLADEVAQRKPDLIGLQEVALWRRGQVGAPDGPATPAEEVVVDFLDEFQRQLDNRGLNYRVAVQQQEADIELPVDRTHDATANPTFDGRLTMRDVILAKGGLRLRNRQHANFASFLPAPTALGTINVLRGWTAVDVRKGRRKSNPPKFRFINTHLEAFSALFRNAQANELAGALGPTDTDLPVILVGDLNSDPADASPESDAYNAFINAGFTDRGVPVDTCCHDADLRNPPPAAFTSRIDHILSKGTVSGLSSALVGADAAMRTPTNLWPSDHGGVVATLRVR